MVGVNATGIVLRCFMMLLLLLFVKKKKKRTVFRFSEPKTKTRSRVTTYMILLSITSTRAYPLLTTDGLLCVFCVCRPLVMRDQTYGGFTVAGGRKFVFRNFRLIDLNSVKDGKCENYNFLSSSYLHDWWVYIFRVFRL